MAWFEDDPGHADNEPTYEAAAIPGLRPLHVRLYRLLWVYVGTRRYEGRPVVYPHQATLAARLGVSERTVKTLIADLRTPDSRTKNRAGKTIPLELGWLRVDWEPARDRATKHREPWHDGRGRWQARDGGRAGVRGRNSYTLLLDLHHVPDFPIPSRAPDADGQVRPKGSTRFHRSDQREASAEGPPDRQDNRRDQPMPTESSMGGVAFPQVTPKGSAEHRRSRQGEANAAREAATAACEPPEVPSVNALVIPKGSGIAAAHTMGKLEDTSFPQVRPKGSGDLLPFMNQLEALLSRSLVS
jgi:hypothetical protein